MIIKLGNGNEIILGDVVKDPRAEAIQWLRVYKESHEKSPGRTQASTTPISPQERSLCNGKENSITE